MSIVPVYIPSLCDVFLYFLQGQATHVATHVWNVANFVTDEV